MCWRQIRVLSLILCFLVVLGCSDDDGDEIIGIDEPTVDNTTPPDANEDSSLPLAPNFTLPDTELEEVSLSDYEGKVVLLDFWATYCKPCEEEIPLFVELYDEYRGQGFEMIGISLDDGLDVVDPFIQRLGVNYTILLAVPGLVQKYNIPGLPAAFLINRRGRIVKVFDGEQEKATYESELKKWL